MVTKIRSYNVHNLGTVYRFEVVRTLKKKSFWIMAIAFPLMMGAVFGVIFLSNQATNDVAEKMKDATFSLAITDESGVINQAELRAIQAQTPNNKADGIRLVKEGKVDAYFYYPKDLVTEKVGVYGKDAGIFDNGKYTEVAKAILQKFAAEGVEPNVAAVLAGASTFEATTYRDGKIYDGISEAMVPGIFLVLFYFLIAMFGNQMLTSTTEEKENRVIEMILTTMKARVLITGKILSLVTLALIQAVVFLLPVLIAYLLLHDKLSLPALDLSSLVFNPARIAAAVALFVGSFMLFTGLLVAIGAASPTAKEASGYLGIVMVLLFGPLYAFSLFLSSPESPFVQFLTLFPLTAPIPALTRNAVGNLPLTDTLIVIGLLTLSSVIVMRIAVRVFQTGAIEYNRNMLTALFKKK